jgi:hypothetical protein
VDYLKWHEVQEFLTSPIYICTILIIQKSEEKGVPTLRLTLIVFKRKLARVGVGAAGAA